MKTEIVYIVIGGWNHEGYEIVSVHRDKAGAEKEQKEMEAEIKVGLSFYEFVDIQRFQLK